MNRTLTHLVEQFVGVGGGMAQPVPPPPSLPETLVTHPETAWLVDSVPLWAAMATILLFTLLLRGRLRTALHTMLTRRAAQRQTGPVEVTLFWSPPIVTEQQLLLLCLAAVLIVLLLLSRIAPLFIALLLSGPAVAGITWLLLWMREQKYIDKLDRALPATVGRLVAQLKSGNGIQPALEALIVDMPAGPLHSEWEFLLAKLGAPLAGGRRATPDQVVGALAAQTPSRRHATFLRHVEVALGQTQDVLILRCQAAYRGMHADEQRRSQASTELAMMRYSGIMITLAGATMALYMALTYWSRFAAAYQGTLGTVVGLVVLTLIIQPTLVGYWLSRSELFEY